MKRVFRLPLTRRRLAADADAELAFHLEGRIEELMSLGMTRDAATAEALRRLGDVEAHRHAMRAIDEETLRMQRRTDLIDTFGREMKYALRALRRAPSFTLMTLVTLALGLGAATAIFTILDAVVLRPLPYPNGDRLVALSTPVPGMKASPEWGLARHEVFYFKQRSRTLEDVGVYNGDVALIPGDGGSHDAERVPLVYVSANLFAVLGIVPERGRLFNWDDNRRAKDTIDVALLTHGFWTRRFGGDPAIVGKRLDLEGYPVTVVGVLPANAELPDRKADLWLPLGMNAADPAISNHVFAGVGRLRPGTNVADAQRELTALTAQFPEVFGGFYTPRFMQTTGFTTRVISLRDDVVGPFVTKALWIIFAAVSVVLLIAAANVANLFLVRLEARRLETALRSAVGASRADLAWHHLAESLTLAVVAAFGAIAVAWGGLRILVAFAPSSLPRLEEVHLAWPSVIFAFVCSVVAGVLLAISPSLRRVDLTLLREGGRGGTGSRRRLAARNVLVVAQMALALMLLAAAGLLVRSLRNLHSVKSGFDARNVLTLSLTLPNGRYRAYDTAARLFEQLATRIGSLPGVRSVGFGNELPLEMSDGCTSAVVDAPGPSGERSDCVQMMMVTPGYFETLGIAIQGHAPTWAETIAGGAGAIVSGAFANRFWPNDNPIGRGVRCCNGTPPYYRIVGVTGAVRTHGLDRTPGQVVYFPAIPFSGKNKGIEWNLTTSSMVVRTTSGAPMQTLVPAIRGVVSEIDPQIPITDIAPMEEILAKSLARRSFTMMLLATAAALALVLSAVGIYGVISYVVAQRRSEIGIRMALGARAAEVRALVVRQSLGLACVGVGIGLVAALATTRALGALLFGVSPTDPLVLASATVVLLALAAAASYAPARRASKVDPVEALRA
jgi:predicted permease